MSLLTGIIVSLLELRAVDGRCTNALTFRPVTTRAALTLHLGVHAGVGCDRWDGENSHS